MSRMYFGTDGIRDVAGEGLLAPAVVRACGRALGRLLADNGNQARVLAGRDTRRSGAELLDQLAEGLLAHGHQLCDGGVLTTPAVQTIAREEGFDLAIVVSASHNPAADNGLKFFGHDGRKLPDATEQRIETLLDEELEQPSVVARAGSRVTDPAAARRYMRFLREACFPDLDLSGRTLVLDCAHGAAYDIAPKALRMFGAEVLTRGVAPDGWNINAGVGVFHVAELHAQVSSSGACLGIALDGDADRVMLMDELGVVRDGDHMLGVFAADLATSRLLEGRTLVSTVMANLGLVKRCRQLGVHCELTPVGDRHVAAAMHKLQSVLGGEQSGHIIFRQGTRWFGDGLYTALRMLEIMSRTGLSLGALAAPVAKFPQCLLNVRVAQRVPLLQLPDLARAQAEVEARLGADGRVLLRYSGTELLLRVMVEGPDEVTVNAMADELASVARRCLGAG
ncbi:MAG: phosphoglucosamine mutase [Planctomycetes bacterium]|nr:phosphoglucosamine mutase [Planctomycetota bacterium]